MKKQLDTTFIRSELSGNSAFFPNYKKDNSPTPEREKADTSGAEMEQVNRQEPPVPPVRDVRPVLPVPPVPLKRVMKQRWPVDIYQDQYDSLKALALEERKRGELGSMSAMIREALDKLIAEKRAK